MVDETIPFRPRPPALEQSLSPEERARRLGVEVERLARLPTVEWLLYLDDVAKKYDVTSKQLKQMVEKTIQAAEKKRKEDEAETRRQDKRAEQQERRREDRQLKEDRHKQQAEDKAAEKRQREQEKAPAEIANLPTAVHEQQLAALARRLGKSIEFLRGELSHVVAEQESGVAVSVPPEPVVEPVNLNALLTDTVAQIGRYVLLYDPDAAVTTVLWVAFAWIHHVAVHSPILRIVAGDIDSGKTTLCGVLAFLTPRGTTTAEPSGPGLFRFVDRVCPTLIIDNADKLLLRNPELRSIIEASWTRGTPIPRVVEKQTYLFKVFCPKVLAGIDLPGLDPATLSRCIEVRLWPKLEEDKSKVEDFKYVDDDAFVALRARWARFAADHAAALADADPEMTGFNNRVRMNWKLPFAIADLAGATWSKRIRKAAAKVRTEQYEPSERKRALAKLWDAFAAFGPLVTSKGLEGFFGKDEEWSNFHNRGPITKFQIAALLRPFGIKPDVIHPRGHAADRGYSSSWEMIEKSFRHYLGKEPPPARTLVRQPRGKS